MRYFYLTLITVMIVGCAQQAPVYTTTKNPYLIDTDQEKDLAKEDVKLVVPSAPIYEGLAAEKASSGVKEMKTPQTKMRRSKKSLEESIELLLEDTAVEPLMIIISDGKRLADKNSVHETKGFRMFSEGKPVQALKSQAKVELQGHFAETKLKMIYPKLMGDLQFNCPLPADAGIRDFVMSLGSRRIRGVLTPRDRAREIFERAREAGFNTVLVSKEDFGKLLIKIKLTTKEPVVIDLHYTHMLKFKNGFFSYELPELDLKEKGEILFFNTGKPEQLKHKGAFRRQVKIAYKNKLFYSVRQGQRAYVFWDDKTNQFLSFLDSLPKYYEAEIKHYDRSEITGDALMAYAVYHRVREVLKNHEKVNFEQLHALALKYKVLTPWSSILAVNASE